MEIAIFIIWLLCGFASLAIADSKGRSSCGWFIGGFLLGPIGLLIIAVLPPVEAEIEKQKLESKEYKKCPQCAELVKKEAKICRFCKYEFKEEQEEQDKRRWYLVHKGGDKKIGPLDTEMVKQWIKEKKILQNDLLREEGKKDWHTLDSSCGENTFLSHIFQ